MLLAIAELVGVLVRVGRINTVQRLLVPERVGPEATVGLEVGRRGGQPAFIRGDRAFGITGLGRAKEGEFVAQLLGFFGADCGNRKRRDAAEGGAKSELEFHRGVSLRFWIY